MDKTNTDSQERTDIRRILNSIKHAEKENGGEGYFLDKQSIKAVFDKIPGGSLDGELARLAMIDGMYSTQMNRRYYALEELAGNIVELRNISPKKLEVVFTDFAKDPGSKDIPNAFTNLWDSSYGIGKYLGDNDEPIEKGVAISLISKYAYFATEYKFPIYDTIACEVLPLLAKMLKIGGIKGSTLKVKKSGGQRTAGLDTIKNFIKAINSFKQEYGDNSEDDFYDIFDRLLWYTGKIRRGNLSLILSRTEYVEWAKMTSSPRNDKAYKNAIETITPEAFMVCLDRNRSKESKVMLEKLYGLAQSFGEKKRNKRRRQD